MQGKLNLPRLACACLCFLGLDTGQDGTGQCPSPLGICTSQSPALGRGVHAGGAAGQVAKGYGRAGKPHVKHRSQSQGLIRLTSLPCRKASLNHTSDPQPPRPGPRHGCGKPSACDCSSRGVSAEHRLRHHQQLRARLVLGAFSRLQP